MNLSASHIAELLLKKLNGEISVEDLSTLEQWKNSSAAATQKYNELTNLYSLQQKRKLYTEAKHRADALTIHFKENTPIPTKQSTIILKWYWAAAILVLAIGSGIYYFSNQSSKSVANNGRAEETKGMMEDIAPGTNRAVLTINDDQNIDLATDKSSININNTITYNDGEKIADIGQWLQLTTPRGGQYQAVLPDGSKVWLNAVSSIKFPSKFGKERRVEVTGEVYFEVAKDVKKPFKVVGGGQEVLVLGTAFNVNVYDDEPVQQTTLLSGSIKVITAGNSLILKPGQGSDVRNRKAFFSAGWNGDWRNGQINFNNASFASIMRQLARWYDIEIRYVNGVPDVVFAGRLDRNVPLSKVLTFLRESGVHIQMNDRTLTINR